MVRTLKYLGIVWLISVAVLWVGERTGHPVTSSPSQPLAYGPSALRSLSDCRQSNPELANYFSTCEKAADRTNLYTGGQ